MKRSATAIDDLGRTYYTPIGTAEADLTAASMSLDHLLAQRDLTDSERRDFEIADRAVSRALAKLRPRVDFDLAEPKALAERTAAADGACLHEDVRVMGCELRCVACGYALPAEVRSERDARIREASAPTQRASAPTQRAE